MSTPPRVRGTANRQWSPGAAGPVLKPTTGIFGWLADEAEDLAWQEQALCAQSDPEMWFPDRGQDIRAAKRVCQACEVRAECLGYALEHNERFGVWGGLSEHQRRRLKRQAA